MTSTTMRRGEIGGPLRVPPSTPRFCVGYIIAPVTDETRPGGEDPAIQIAVGPSENLAHEALSDGNVSRRERRLAWRAERRIDETVAADGAYGPTSAALLESLLLKDIIAWSQKLTPAQRDYVLTMDPTRLPPHFLTLSRGYGAERGFAEIEQIKCRVLCRAEQLSNIYLDDAENAADQSSMELAQKLAAQSITRLAGLRHLVSESGLR